MDSTETIRRIPLTSRYGAANSYPEEAWNNMRAEIEAMYLEQRMTIPEVCHALGSLGFRVK
jgi:Clr5 domain